MMTQTFKLLGTTLALVALYLLLRYSTNASTLMRAGFGGWADVLRTLQARD